VTMSVCPLMRATLLVIMPGSIRLFVPDTLSPGEAIAASPAQAHHLGTVMRRGVGDEVRVFNGRDGEFSATIETLRRDRLTIRLGQRVREQADEPDLWLLFAPLKRDATDLVAEKATELGASVLWPVLTARTVASRVNLDRMAAIAAEAAEQCERLTVPRILPPAPLETVLADWPRGRMLFAALERDDAAASLPFTLMGPAAILIGPEGGFTDDERRRLRAHQAVVSVALGPRVLRAETAAIVGLALLQSAISR
jgi:16S rRNA (uracil1498-N3)-methyltransferase